MIAERSKSGALGVHGRHDGHDDLKGQFHHGLCLIRQPKS